MKKIFKKLSWLFLLFNAKTIFAAIVIGNSLGTITLVEIYDYQCPYCRAMNGVINLLIQENPQLRVVLRVMPAFGEPSMAEDSLALAAVCQHKFSLFHQALMQFDVAPTQSQVVRLAKSLGLNSHQLQRDSHKAAITHALQQNWQAFVDTKATGIPVLLIGYTRSDKVSAEFIGETSYSDLQQVISKLTNPKTVKG